MPTLDWIGKKKVVNHHLDVPFRVLEKKYTYSVDNKSKESENKIIHGDNLETLKSLLPEYEGKIDCIYIEPPYNTGNTIDKGGWAYNDNVSVPKIEKWLGEVVYVFTNSSDFFKTVERIAYTLNQNHFTGKDFRAYEESERIIETPAPTPEQSELELTPQTAANQATQEKEENKKQKIEVPELQSQLKKNQYAMKEDFKEFASSLKIPQFSLPVNLPPHFAGIF